MLFQTVSKMMRVNNASITAWEDGSMSLTLRSRTAFSLANKHEQLDQAQISLLFFLSDHHFMKRLGEIGQCCS